MAAIRDFFKKKKLDSMFKRAGRGHHLNEQSAPSSAVPAPNRIVQPRQQHSEGAQRAGAAALARLEQQRPSTSDRSLAAIRAQARRELAAEMQASEKASESQGAQGISTGGQKEVCLDSAPVLAAYGVYYTCPFIGPDVLPRAEIQAKIKEFLFEHLEDEPGLTACLIIHSCNNREKISTCIETLCKYLLNIESNPTDEKYRKIRLNNKVYQERVAPVIGALEFLLAAGFTQQQLPHGEGEDSFLVFPENRLGDLESLAQLRENLTDAEPIVPTLDRGLRVLLPSQSIHQVELPLDFYNVTLGELKREQDERSQSVELLTQLRTKAMRERDELRDLRKYRYTLIRIQMPDGIVLQGTFSVHEKLGEVRDFVQEKLIDTGYDFHLLAPGGGRLMEDDSTLLDLHLVPAVVLHLAWEESAERRLTIVGDDEPFLKPEILALLQNT